MHPLWHVRTVFELLIRRVRFVILIIQDGSGRDILRDPLPRHLGLQRPKRFSLCHTRYHLRLHVTSGSIGRLLHVVADD